jgi:RecJ-like exonuclease
VLLYIAWTGIKQITTSSQSSSNSIKAPTTFNNSMNINVWFKTVKEYLNKSSISTNQQKQKCSMQFLDAQSQRILQAKSTKVKSKHTQI